MRYKTEFSLFSYGNEESDQMMALLQDLSMLKEMDVAFEANPIETEREAHHPRQHRKHEIGLEMKALAEQKEERRTTGI
jgi:hypothetical protein